MNADIIVGRAQQVAGKVLELWGRLTDSDLQRQHGYQLVIIGQMRVLGGRATGLLRYCTPRQVLATQTAQPPPG